jgi:hypothetical protein
MQARLSGTVLDEWSDPVSHHRLVQALVTVFTLLLTSLPVRAAAHALHAKTAPASIAAGSAPFQGPLAVIVDYEPFGHPLPVNTTGRVTRAYKALLIDTHGKVVASVQTIANSVRLVGAGPPMLTLASASATNLYYVDDAQTVHELGRGGKTRVVAHLQGNAHTLFGISVSPDNRTLVVAAIEYTLAMQQTLGGTRILAGGPPVRERLYTQDLASGKRQVIYTTTITAADMGTSTQLAWPIGWRGNDVVLALGFAGQQDGPANPYDAWNGYRVISSTGGALVANVCPSNDGAAEGPVVQAGSICVVSKASESELFIQDWSGQCTAFPASRSATFNTVHAPTIAPAPNGSAIAVYDQSQHRTVMLLKGNPHPVPLRTTQAPLGWLDDTHLMMTAAPAPVPTADNVQIYDIRSGISTSVLPLRQSFQTLFFLGLLPGGLGNRMPTGPATSGASSLVSC